MMSGVIEMRAMRRLTSDDSEMKEVLQNMSDDTGMMEAQQQTTDDFEMRDATTEAGSNKTSRETEDESSMECLEESVGADSSKEILEAPQSTPAKGRDNSAKENVEEPQSTSVKDNIKSAEASEEESRSSLERGGDKPTKENTVELRSAPLEEVNVSAKDCMEEPQSSPVKGGNKSAEESIGEQESSSVKGEDKSAEERKDEPREASAKDRDISAKKGVKEPQSAPVEGGENSQGSIAEPQLEPVTDDDKSPIQSVEIPQSPEVKGRHELPRENMQEMQLAAMRLDDEASLGSLEESEPAVMSLEDMVKELKDNPMEFERDKEDRFEMILVERERKKNDQNSGMDNSQEQTMAEWKKAVERNHERLRECCHMDAPCQQSVKQIKMERLPPYKFTDFPCQKVMEKRGNVDSPGKQSMDEREKERNQPPSYKDIRTQQTLPNREKESTSSYKNQVADKRGNSSFQPSSHLDDPRKHTMGESKKVTNQGYGYEDNSPQPTLLQREKERKSPSKIQARDRPSPVELSSSQPSDYFNGRCHRFQGTGNRFQGTGHRFQGTGYRKTEKYNGNNDFAYDDDSLNRMSPRERNSRSETRGREQNWRTTHHHYSSNDQHSTCGEGSTYSEVPHPSQLISVLSEFPDFHASLLELWESKNLQPDTVRKTVNAHTNVFQLVRESVELRPKLSFCSAHIGKHGCQSKESCSEMHICPVYARSYCHNENCVLGHKWFTQHNKLVLRSFYMQDLSAKDLRKIVKLTNASGSFGQLGICKAYNESNCSNHNCDDLHICHSFVAGRSKCSRSVCRLNHDILSRECSELLARHGFSTNEAPRDVVLALLSANSSIAHTPADKPLNNLANKDSSDKRSSDTSRSNETSQMIKKGNTSDYNSSRQGKSSKAVWANHLQGDSVLAEICFYSVEGMCRNENSGCPRLHSSLHYHWQVSEQGTNWFNLCIHQVTALEHAFCDPFQDGVMLPKVDPSKLSPTMKGLLTVLGRETWRANFEAMLLTNSDFSKVLYIRRLCTERIIGKQLKPNTYVWYFLDKNNKWVRYGNVDSAGETKLVSSVTSAEIEKHFCKSPSVPLIFQNAAFRYSIDFAQMTQRNQQTKVIRRVLRRPEPHINAGKK